MSNGRQTAATVALGAVMGAIAGGIFGVVRGKTQRGGAPKGRGGLELGYEWPQVRTDHDLCEFIARLSAFRHASDQHYRAVGDACDDMVALMILAHDYTVPAQALWQTKSFRYVKRVGDALTGLEDAVAEARRLAAARLVTESRSSRRAHGATKNEGGNMLEFDTCAAGIYGIMENYHASIARTIAIRAGNAPVGQEDDGQDSDYGDDGSDASDLDSECSDDDEYTDDGDDDGA